MLTEADLKTVYATGENEPSEFFLDALMNSISLDFGLGYFSTSGFRALAIGFAFFIKKGGKMKMIINNVLSEEDKKAVMNGVGKNPSEFFEDHVIQDILKLKETLSKKDEHFFRCVSWMIASGKLELKATIPKKSKIGIVHQKFGLFRDTQNNKVVFTGSVNFSETAILHNVEAIWCDFSWIKSPTSKKRVTHFEDIFNKAWSGESDVVEIIPLDKVKTVITELFPVQDLQQLVNDELDLAKNELVDQKQSTSYKTKVQKLISSPQISTLSKDQNFPELRPYQKEAVKKWEESNYQGLLEMATGTGKTITALSCARLLQQSEGSINLIILVPTLDLAVQWMEETKKYLLKNVILANSQNRSWYTDTLSALHQGRSGSKYCVIATYATFLTNRFQALIKKAASTTLLIADEVHNFGTKNHIAKYPMHIQRRIGLSATPNRYFDSEGTESILSYFNAKSGPTFRFSMAEAIENGFLCEYFYYPVIVQLTDPELGAYKAISKRLLQYFNKNSGFSDNPIVTALLLKRKRIIHQASGKFDAFRKILKQLTEERTNLKYILVYVPEGVDHKIDNDDRKLINAYSKIIVEEFGLSQHQFIGLTDNRENILEEFSKGEIAVLTAMKCLDEGVDVKRAEFAIFCSSTGNPRQFIQRRGRILRTHPNKKNSTIYDMIVVPALTNQYFEDSLQMERSILQSELRRVQEFASLSLNHYQALQMLESVTNEFNLDIFSKEII